MKLWIGPRLGELRVLRKLTQEAVGCMAGMSQGEISKMEKGNVDPGFMATLRMLRYMGLSLRVVVTDDGDPAEGLLKGDRTA